MRRFALLALLVALPACTEEAAPTSPAEALFIVNPGGGNRQFELVELTAQNARHTANQSFPAPYSFYMENAFPPVQGIFLPDPEGNMPVADVQLFFGGETVPRVVSDPSQNPANCVLPAECEPESPSESTGCLCVNSSPPGGVIPEPAPPQFEIRFDIVATPPIQFTGDVGSINQDHIISVGQTPATIYLEGAEESAAGVFTKFDSGASLTATLLINGVARATSTTGPGNSGDAVVQFQFD